MSHSGEIVPFTMRVDQPPFNDVNVRQAMRLLVDRPQLIDSALDSYGVVANDLFSPYDPDFDHSLVRAAQGDIPQAKFLLKKAGAGRADRELTTSAVATGTVAMATVLAAQAKAAGVTINLNNVPPGTFFGPNYLKWTFAQDYYNYYPYLSQVAESMLLGSPFNETHTNNPQYTSLYNQANATANPSLRKEILQEMQRFDFTQGGYIIPAYIDVLDAYSDKITGYTRRQGRPAAVQLRLRALRVRRLARAPSKEPGPDGGSCRPGQAVGTGRARSAAPRYRSSMFFTDRVVLIIPVPYMRSATRWTCPTLRNVGYCPIVTRDASREDISGSVRSTDWTVPGWAALALASSSAARKACKAAVLPRAKLAVVK